MPADRIDAAELVNLGKKMFSSVYQGLPTYDVGRLN